MAQLQQFESGFDCEFVVKPPKVFQSECPICLQVLREPYQSTCCGKSYCRVCIDRLKAGRNKCACCNKSIKDFPNIGLQQSLYDFKVHCGNKNQGCQWVGELRQLDDHLNVDPSKEKQFEGCQFTHIQCLYCDEQGYRSIIQSHQKEDCLKRPFKCCHCNSYESTYQDVTTNHWPICQYRPEPCPNMCGFKFSQRNLRDLDSHILNDCPLTKIDCEYKRVGCNAEVLRKDMHTHLDENIAHHLSLQAAKQRRLAKSIKSGDQRSSQVKLLTEGTKLLCENTASHMLLTSDILVEHKKKQQDIPWVLGAVLIISAIVMMITHCQERNQLKEQIAELAQDVETLRSHASLCPLYINFTDFGLHRQKNDTWYSPSFYTHPRGYKMCLKIYANGRKSSSKGKRKNNNIAVFLLLMRGSFDSELKWPFHGRITVQLLNQISDGKNENIEKTYNFDNTVSYKITNRVQNRERAKSGLGFYSFISHGDLWPKYLRNNHLRFYIKCDTYL